MANYQPSGPMRARGRTRDYTIPVRLNNQQIMSTNIIPQRGRRTPRGVLQQLVSIIGARQIIPYLLTMIVVVLASTKVQQSHCDTKLNSSYSSSLSLSSSAAASPIKQLKSASSKVSTPKGAIDNATGRKQNERLLAALSENIERQHFRQMANSFMKQQQRPSKFDSGDVSVEMLHTGGSLSNQAKKSSGEQALNDIMRMHEQPSRPIHYTAAANSYQLQTSESSPQPVSVKPKKIVTQLLSYIVHSPLTGAAKLMSADGVNSQVDTPNNTSKLHLRPFTGRSNAATPNPSILHKPFLALPNWIKGKTSSYSSKPSTMFGDDSSRGWMMSSPANQAVDLIAADSNAAPQHQQAPPARFTGRQNRGNKDPEDTDKATAGKSRPGSMLVEKWLKNQIAQNYLQDSFRGLLTLSQLPILPVGPVSTAPSVLEPRPAQQKRRNIFTSANNNNSNKQQQVIQASGTTDGGVASASTDDKVSVSPPNRRSKALEDLYRYAYIVGTSMIGRKRDPLKALSTQTRPTTDRPPSKNITQRSIGQLAADNRRQMENLVKALQQALFGSSTFLIPGGGKQQAANPRGVMWDMATDPTLVVTLMHMIEKASVALPLGFLLMPIVQMIRMNPLGGVNLSRMLPVRALHRSVEHELLAKRLDAVDKVLSRALRQTHREATLGKRK